MTLREENFNSKKYLNEIWNEDASSNLSSSTGAPLIEKICAKNSVALYYYHYLFNQKKKSSEKYEPLYKIVLNRKEDNLVNEATNISNKNANNINHIKNKKNFLKPILKKRNVKEMRFRNYGLHRNLDSGLISKLQKSMQKQLDLVEKC
jgi:hypothetical protein